MLTSGSSMAKVLNFLFTLAMWREKKAGCTFPTQRLFVNSRFKWPVCSDDVQ